MIRKRSVQIEFNQIQTFMLIRIQRAWRRHQFRINIASLLKHRKRKRFTAIQLLESEKKYCDNLQRLVNQVMIPAKPIIADQQSHAMMFSELAQISKLHNQFLVQLDGLMSQYNNYTTKLSVVIIQHLFNKPGFKEKYSNYCANYQKSNKIAKLLFTTNSGLNQILKKVGINDENQLDSALISPMQRLCKYELMLNSYQKNLKQDHCDYLGLQNAIASVEKLVRETNQFVEQFLLADKFRLYKQFENDTLQQIPNQNRYLVFINQGIAQIDLVTGYATSYKQLAMFNDSILLLPFDNQTKPTFIPLYFVRDLPNLKYFKNIVQIITAEKYMTIQFKKQKHKQNFMGKLKKTNIYDTENKFITVKVLGTQSREAVFKSYTVYIVQLTYGQQTKTIYPRFKCLLKVLQIIQSKKIKITLPSMSKQSLFWTLKSKTIERRMLAIQQFLQKILNHSQCRNIPEVMKILKLNIGQQLLKTDLGIQKPINKNNLKQLIITLPGEQIITIQIAVETTNVVDLKQALTEKLGLTYSEQFELFQLRNKKKRLLYNDEHVKQMYNSQQTTLNSLNPFKDIVSFLYTRHHYLQVEEQSELYKTDFIRTELELSVIKSEIRSYKLEEQLMITFMALFALYVNLPVNQDKTLASFMKKICKKQYNISNEEFRSYYSEVEKKIFEQEHDPIAIPFLIIKILGKSSFLYQCQQFQVTVHPKSYKQIKENIKGLEEQIILGVKRTHILLLTVQSKHIVQSFPIESVQIAEKYPTGLVLKLQDITPLLRLNTQNGFQISKLLQIYKNK